MASPRIEGVLHYLRGVSWFYVFVHFKPPVVGGVVGAGFVHPVDTQHLWWKLLSVLANLTRCLVQTSAAPDVSVAPSARADPPVVAASPVLPWHLEGHGPWSVRDPQAA